MHQDGALHPTIVVIIKEEAQNEGVSKRQWTIARIQSQPQLQIVSSPHNQQ